MRRQEPRGVLLAASAAVLLLALTGPSPTGAVRELRQAGSALDPTGPLVAAVALLAWALAAWLVLTVVLTLLTRLPGQAGRVAAAATRRVAPAGLRRVVAASLGITVVAGTLVASPASATSAGPVAAPAATAPIDLDWPVAGSAGDLTDRSPAEPSSAEPSPAEPPPAEPSPADPSPKDPVPSAGAGGTSGTGSAAHHAVVVRPGDTLWGLAEQALAGVGPSAAPSAAQVATAWPCWWAANREAIGDDPDLLLPGTVLHPPPGAARAAP